METKNIVYGVIAVVVVLAFIFGTKVEATENANMYQKDSVTWERTGDGHGLITFDGNTFAFEGHNLSGEYSLVVFDTGVDDEDTNEDGNDRFPSAEWNNQEGPLLATGTADNHNNLTLTGEVACLDEAKIWLVPSSDVKDDATITNWGNRENWLFEHARFSTCLPEPSPSPKASNEPSIGDGDKGAQDTNCADLDALTEEQALGDCGVSKVSKVEPVVETLEVVEKVQTVEELVVFPSTGMDLLGFIK